MSTAVIGSCSVLDAPAFSGVPTVSFDLPSSCHTLKLVLLMIFERENTVPVVLHVRDNPTPCCGFRQSHVQLAHA